MGMFNEANAIALWLNREGFDVEDVTAGPNQMGTITFDVDLAEPDQRERYEELLEDSPYVTSALDTAHGKKSAIHSLANLGPLEGECSHTECKSDVDEYVIFPRIDEVRTYCGDHAGGARESLKGDASAASK